MTPDHLVVPVQPDGNYPDIEPVEKHSDVQRGIEPICHPVVRAAATRFMSVPLGRSPPVLRAGVRGKLDLAWRFRENNKSYAS
jgi:hypothetical protein